MKSQALRRIQIAIATVAAGLLCLIAAPGAGAATVINGDFETGNLTGWSVFNLPPAPASSGSWFAYTGTQPPFEFAPEVPPPPAGNYAAITSQGGEGTHILYQDVALEPYYTHQLSLLAFYRSEAALATPFPESLNTQEGSPNQQYRIDVMKPTAAITSVDPADILATVLATKTGDPEELGPTLLTANLTPFAGQTVRLRFAEADNQLFLAAGVDSVSIQSTPPSNVFSLGKPTLNKKKGTAKLPVSVPGAGSLKITDVKTTKKRIKAMTVQATAAGTLKVSINPTKSARKALEAKHKLKIKVQVAFTPTGGLVATQTRKLTLKLTP